MILALKERLQRQLDAAPDGRQTLVHRLDQLALRCAARPVRDRRSADEICGYETLGLPS